MKIKWQEIWSIVTRQHPAFHQTRVTLPPKVTKEPPSRVTRVPKQPYDQDEGLTGPRAVP